MADIKKHPCYECEFKHHLCKAECDILRNYEKERIEKYKEKEKVFVKKEYYEDKYTSVLRKRANYFGRW